MPSGNKFICVCGFRGNSGHAGQCRVYKKAVTEAVDNMKLYIADFYKTCYSITDCCKYVIEKENVKIGESSLRPHITRFLDSLGIREKLNSNKLNQCRQEKVRRTMLDRYGVINAGQIPGNGFGDRNLIPYTKLRINDEYTEFRKKVEHLTHKTQDKLKKERLVPEHCYYTGILFNDVRLEKINPNDPLKRSIDHKTSVIEAFLRGWSVEKTCVISNLVFCLRIVNTVKGHLNEQDFRKLLLPLLKKRLEDESKNG